MLTNTTNVARYLINTTPLSTYSISFPYWDKEEIKVYLTKADGTLETLVEGTNYTLTTPNGVSGTLTRVGDWTAGATNLTIMREMDLTQEVDLRNGDKIDAETLETAFDTATAQIQQLSEAQSRAVTTSVDEAGGNLAIPSKALRAGSGSGTMMGFGPDGNEVVLRDLAGFDADVASAASNASSASASAGTATTQALKSEGYAVGEQNGTPVTSGSPYCENNSKHYAQVAKAGADVITDNLTAITNLDTNMTDINAVADDISNVVAVAGDLTKVDAVADDLTNIDAVNANKTNIDTVAGIASDVTDVAGVASDIPTVAGVSTDISAVATDISDVSAVAGDLVKVKAVADDLTNIDAVNANKTNIDTVAGKASEITTVAGKANDVTTVAGIASNVTTVAGKASEVTTVAGIASDVSAVAQVASDVASVADELTDIGTVASNISDVAAVGADIAKVSAVADDLTSIDAVYADLANIDAADDHALEAEGWAAGTQNGVPVTSGSPYYENNAKYYGQEIPNLKSAIQANSNRISNLEEKADPTGAYKTVNYRGTNDVPTGKAKYALVESIVGKSRAWNQLVNQSTLKSDVVNDVTFTASGNTITVSGTCNNNTQHALINSSRPDAIIGHKYLVAGNRTNLDVRLGDGASATFHTGYMFVEEAQTVNALQLAVRMYNTVSYSGTFTLIIRDLTVIFPDLPSTDLVTSNIPNLVKRCPDLLKYDNLFADGGDGYSIVDTVVEGVRSDGVNIWDEEWEDGTISQSTGENSDNNNTIRSEGYIPVTPSTNYSPYVNGMPMYHIGIFYYDYNKNFISYGNPNNTTKLFQTPSGCFYIRFACSVTYGSTYNHNIAIAKSDTALTQYYPYMTDTLSLPSPVTLRSAGSVADTDEMNVEVSEGVFKRRQMNRIGQIDMGTMNWGIDSGRFYAPISDIKIVDTRIGELVCPLYICISDGRAYNLVPDKAIYTAGNNIYVRDDSYDNKDTFKTAMNGVPLNYELADPVVTLLDPIIDNTLLTEGGGTINTIQNNVYPDESPAPVIDNSLDVGYLAL